MSDADIGAFYASLLADMSKTKPKEALGVPEINYMKVSTLGKLTIYFTEKLLVKEPDQITSDVLELTLLSESDIPEEYHSFSWRAIEFSEDRLVLQLSFDYPVWISSGAISDWDQIDVLVKNPFMFRS